MYLWINVSSDAFFIFFFLEGGGSISLKLRNYYIHYMWQRIIILVMLRIMKIWPFKMMHPWLKTETIWILFRCWIGKKKMVGKNYPHPTLGQKKNWPFLTKAGIYQLSYYTRTLISGVIIFYFFLLPPSHEHDNW